MSAPIHRRARPASKMDTAAVFLAIFSLILASSSARHASLADDAAAAAESPVSWNDDVLGLLVFKAGLQDPRGSLASWNEADPSPCNWTGIRCGVASGRVESVSLDDLALSGTIGRGLLKLDHLKTLSLSANNLSGSVVPELFRMLDFVDLRKNRLSGSIPSPMGASIRYVDLSDNALEGILPGDFFGGGHLLRYLSLSNNKLAGQLSSFDAANQTNLATFRLAGNRFDGSLPDWIGRGFRSLQDLDLSWNRFQGSIPASMAALSSLRSLNLAGNNLTGYVPQSLLQLLRLSSLDLSRNRFAGKIPLGLFSSSLQFVNLSGNEFVGGFPIWPPCGSLQVVDLSGNRITGELPARIRQCGNLQHLNLGWNDLTGAIPDEISELPRLMFLDLSHNRFKGSLPSSLANLSSITVLKLAKNLLVGSILKNMFKCGRLVDLDLSSNRFSGGIPGELSRLSFLQALDLSWNNLTGPIPKEFVRMESLSRLDVSHNRLEGPIPKGGVFGLMNRTSFQGNPSLCGAALNVACSTVPKPIVLNPNASSEAAGIIQSGGHRGKNKIVLSVSAIIAISAAAVIALGIVVVSVLNIRAQQAAPSAAVLKNTFFMADQQSSPSSSSEDLAIGKLVMFTDGQDTKSEELLPSAQSLLNKEQEIGRGGFGVVYRAAISDGRTFAVKKLVSAGLVKSQLEFEKEVQQLGKIEHPNLVTLQGYYWTSRMQLLIYDFVPNGSLYSRLHEPTFGEPPLTWVDRFKIAQGTALGLSHLHHSCQSQVIHCDLKSSNILLGAGNTPMISDYGLANLLPVLDRYAISSKFQGALGYMAPEFGQGSRVTEKCDVYGFGIILLELVTGRRPVEYMEDDVVILCDYVRSLLNEGRGMNCVEPGLEECPEDEVLPVLKLGLICSSPLPSNRPSMAEVVQILELVRPLPGFDNSNSISRSSSS